MDFYLRIRGSTLDPVTEEEARRRFSRGELPGSTLSWRPGEKGWTSLEERWFKRRNLTRAAVAAWTLSTFVLFLVLVVPDHLPQVLPRTLQSSGVLASAIVIGMLLSFSAVVWYWKISALRTGQPKLGAVLCALWVGLGTVCSLGVLGMHKRVNDVRATLENSSIIFDRAARAIHVDGYIGNRFTEELEDFIASHPAAQRVDINSLGGFADDAFDAGNLLARANLPVRVVKDCASACVILWASAPRREMTVGSRIGLHQIHSDADLPILWKQATTDELDVRTVSLMKLIGFTDDLLEKQAKTPADNMHWVSAIEMLEAGVQLSIVDDHGSIVSLNQARLLRVMKEIDEKMTKINSTLPMMVDEHTRLDKAYSGPGKNFSYIYTLPEYASSDLDSVAVHDAIAPYVRGNVCGNKEMRVSFEAGVTAHYVYQGNDGVEITRLDFSATDCRGISDN